VKIETPYEKRQREFREREANEKDEGLQLKEENKTLTPDEIEYEK
jgi:hypothetical protein